jgi:hypothetical protein
MSTRLDLTAVFRSSSRLILRSIVVATATIVVLSGAEIAHAQPGVPFPPLCSVTLGGQVVPCQYRFRSDGGLDQMTVDIQIEVPPVW